MSLMGVKMIGSSRLAITATLLSSALASPAFGQSSSSPYTSAIRYDSMGRAVGTISANPGSGNPFLATRITYNAGGLPTKTEKGTLSTWQSENIDPANWTGFTLSSSTEVSYDSYGRKTTELLRGSDSVVYGLTQFSYDAQDRLQCTAVRMNTATYGSLPPDACTLGTQGSNGPDRITKSSYDAASQLTKIQKGYGTSVQADYATYTYTPNGKQRDVTDANGNMAEFSYDPHDRLSQWTFPSKTTAGQLNTADYESYGYDANDNRTTVRKRDGTTISYSYDALNRVTHKAGSADSDYSYDLLGRQLTATFSSGGLGITNTYDGFGELLSTSSNMDGTARKLSYLYDADGNRTQVSHPDAASFTYGYDGIDRLNGLYEGVGTAVPLTTFAYTPDGLLSSRSETGGSSVGYSWDKIGRLATQSDSFVGGTGNVSWTLGYNPISQITSDARSNDVYAWTGSVNVNRGYAVNGLNQYTTAGPASFTYDSNGNLTSDGTNSYVYDGENRLTSGTVAGAAVTLSYDPLGRLWRVVKGSSDARFLYDGNALVLEYDSGGNITNRYVHGSNVAADDPLVWYAGAPVGSSNRRYFHADHEGSIVATGSGSSGANASINTYDEYGIPGSGNSGRFQYTGQAWLSELGMYYYKARIYSPTLGRFLQTDPIGYKDQINLYEYVGDDPVDKHDPNGTDAQEAAQWAYDQKGSTDYREDGFNFSHSLLGAYGSPKCNFFVYDALAAGHIAPKTVDGLSRPPVAAEWGDRSSKIDGFRSLGKGEAPAVGDVVSNGGHVGMVVATPYKSADGKSDHGYIVASAADRDHGDKVTLTKFGFRTIDNLPKVVFWRYVRPQVTPEVCRNMNKGAGGC